MKTSKQLFISLIISFWLVLIAVFSIQNIEPIRVKFLIWQSISLPSGVLLTMVIALGFILGVLIPILFTNNNQQKRRKYTNTNSRKRNEFKRDFQEEEDPLFDWE